MFEYQVTRCPALCIAEIDDVLSAYNMYKNGFLPNEGGWLNQPVKFEQTMVLIGSLSDELEKEENA